MYARCSSHVSDSARRRAFCPQSDGCSRTMRNHLLGVARCTNDLPCGHDASSPETLKRIRRSRDRLRPRTSVALLVARNVEELKAVRADRGTCLAATVWSEELVLGQLAVNSDDAALLHVVGFGTRQVSLPPKSPISPLCLVTARHMKRRIFSITGATCNVGIQHRNGERNNHSQRPTNSRSGP